MKILLPAALLTQIVLTPPPVSSAPEGNASARPQRSLVTWTPGEIRCRGTRLVPQLLERPLATLAWGNDPAAAPITYAFDIDSSGRTLNIRRTGKEGRGYGSGEIAPALAASRFAAGAGFTDCSVAYTASQTSVDSAPIAVLTAYSVNAIAGPLPKEAWERLYAGSNCRDERALGLKARVFPDFEAVPATPGVREWTLVGYDIDEDGVTTNVRTIDGTGNTALDRASEKAVAETRYYKGGRQGCRFPYWRTPATLPAPPAPEEKDFVPAGSTCPDEHGWTAKPRMIFAETYRRRSIEGWAVVTYDVAPWGEIANIQVAASQPSEDFGKQAMAVLRSAKAETRQGYVGCVEKVKFVMGTESGLEP